MPGKEVMLSTCNHEPMALCPNFICFPCEKFHPPKPKEVMPLVGEDTIQAISMAAMVKGIPPMVKRAAIDQRDADQKWSDDRLEAQKKEWISLYNEENIKVRNLEAKEKEWRGKERLFVNGLAEIASNLGRGSIIPSVADTASRLLRVKATEILHTCGYQYYECVGKNNIDGWHDAVA